MSLTPLKYLGTIVLTLDGVEIPIDSVDCETKTGNKPVPTMNSQRRALGTSDGIMSYTLKVEAPIPTDGSEPDWANIQGATITIYPAVDNPTGPREIYTECTTETVGAKFKLGDTSKRSISMHALDFQKG